MIKTIGVLTSGGDAPGMNAAVRAVTRTALSRGMKVLGIQRGYVGLLNEEFVELTENSVSDVIYKGGTFIYTARCNEFKDPEVVKKAVEICKKHGLDGIVVVGGDGSFRGAADLSKFGVPCVGVPGTIDNDISCSEYTVGYDTSVNTAIDMIDRLRDTSTSHQRATVVEVMGRNAGYIAINAGIACGATAIITTERPYDVDKIAEKMKKSRANGKASFVIVIAEGVGHTEEIAKEIADKSGIETRVTVLGHVQRGGAPTGRDRVIASQMGHYAVGLLEKGIGNRVVAMQNNHVVDFDIQEALSMKKEFPMDLFEVADDISI